MTDKVAARQVDRDATASFLEWYGGTDKPTLDRIRAGELDDFIPVLTFASHGASARKAALDEAAGVAKSHKPDRKRPLSQFDPEDREIIRAEENGEAIAASVIATAIRALAEKDG